MAVDPRITSGKKTQAQIDAENKAIQAAKSKQGTTTIDSNTLHFGTAPVTPTAPVPVPAPTTPVPQVTPPITGVRGQPASIQPTTISPFDISSIQRSGTYGESVAFRATDYIKNLRKALDAGQISLSDFLKLGQPAAESAFKEIQSVGGKGSKAADLVNPLLNDLQGAGFIKGDDGVIRPKLPDQYQQKAPDQLLPSNIPLDQQKQLLTQLPPGLDPYSDQGKIEVENLREKAQQDAALQKQQNLRNQAITGLQGVIGQQSDIRQSGLSALQKSLEDEANRQFSLDQPGIYEDLNARGLLRSSALGDRLAQQKANYTGQVASELGKAQYSNTQQSADDLNKLAAARLASTDADVSAIQQALLSSNQLQQSGLSRTFGVQDFQSQANLARQIAAMSQPQQANNQLASGFQGALGGAGIGSAFGVPGAVIGGTLGLAGGLATGKGGGK